MLMTKTIDCEVFHKKGDVNNLEALEIGELFKSLNRGDVLDHSVSDCGLYIVFDGCVGNKIHSLNAAGIFHIDESKLEEPLNLKFKEYGFFKDLQNSLLSDFD